jgi:hypothetical protein
MFGFVSEMQRTRDVFRERFGGQRLLGGEIAARIRHEISIIRVLRAGPANGEPQSFSVLVV